MLLRSTFKRIGELGVKSTYLPWEKLITRNLNYISMASVATILCSVIIHLLLSDRNILAEHITALVSIPIIIVVNARLGYKWGLFTFYFVILSLMFYFMVSMGLQTQLYLFFIPLTISLLMLVRRKEIYSAVINLFIMLFIFMVAGIICSYMGWFRGTLSDHEVRLSRIMNIVFSSLLTIAVSTIISEQNSRQEMELNSLLKEKDTLLAEVNHRVKNNMNVITSLLNLKKEHCETEEAREALEDCKNRVYSMALIHQKVYGSRSMKEVNFQEYISELLSELVSSYSTGKEVELKVEADNCLLSLDVAVPCSLIINEVLTNSLKHARQKDKTLVLNVIMKKSGKVIDLLIHDNGPELNEAQKQEKETLGMTLIDLLCGQLDAAYKMTNNNGLQFIMHFTLAK